MMDELNALIAPKKVVDGLAEVFDGLDADILADL